MGGSRSLAYRSSDSDEWIKRGFQAGQVFTPAAPIDAKELFAGRIDQLRTLLDVLGQRGQHAIIYGERGVGKTSLANVHSQYLEDLGTDETKVVAPRINCGSKDSFSELWRKVFSEIELCRKVKNIGVATKAAQMPGGGKITWKKTLNANDVRITLTQLADDIMLVIILDEFDCVESERVKREIAETIKCLSDHAVPVTLVLLGVADSVTELFSHHESIERSLVQIHLPRMSTEEMGNILLKGLTKLQMSIEPDAMKNLTDLARGLPHYVHLLALSAARAAINRRSAEIERQDIASAIESSISNAQQSIRHMYYEATLSRKKDSLYVPLLLSCALANADQFGYFTAADVRDPMSKIMKKGYAIPYFARQLNELSSEKRGSVLQRTDDRRPRFRFRNPLLQPYVVMQGFKHNMVPLFAR